RVASAVSAVLDYTERLARARIAELGDIRGSARDALESDGVSDRDVPVVITLSVAKGRLRFDFTGSSPQVPGNVNCPASVARAAAVFVLRTLLKHDAPTNDGIARAIELVLPDDCAMNAKWPHAVAAGNV